MNTLVWMLQIVLALAFAAAGLMKLTTPRAELATKMGWAEDFSDGTVQLIGAFELAAAVGLILPWATGILPGLTLLAALGLVALMLLAARVHHRRNESQMVMIDLVLAALAVVVAIRRF